MINSEYSKTFLRGLQNLVQITWIKSVSDFEKSVPFFVR